MFAAVATVASPMVSLNSRDVLLPSSKVGALFVKVFSYPEILICSWLADDVHDPDLDARW